MQHGWTRGCRGQQVSSLAGLCTSCRSLGVCMCVWYLVCCSKRPKNNAIILFVLTSLATSASTCPSNIAGVQKGSTVSTQRARTKQMSAQTASLGSGWTDTLPGAYVFTSAKTGEMNTRWKSTQGRAVAYGTPTEGQSRLWSWH